MSNLSEFLSDPKFSGWLRQTVHDKLPAPKANGLTEFTFEASFSFDPDVIAHLIGLPVWYDSIQGILVHANPTQNKPPHMRSGIIVIVNSNSYDILFD